MNEVILSNDERTILESDVPESTPIFARNGGKLVGMIVKSDGLWALYVGGCTTTTGRHETRKVAMEMSKKFGHTYHTE